MNLKNQKDSEFTPSLGKLKKVLGPGLRAQAKAHSISNLSYSSFFFFFFGSSKKVFSTEREKERRKREIGLLLLPVLLLLVVILFT